MIRGWYWKQRGGHEKGFRWWSRGGLAIFWLLANLFGTPQLHWTTSNVLDLPATHTSL